MGTLSIRSGVGPKLGESWHPLLGTESLTDNRIYSRYIRCSMQVDKTTKKHYMGHFHLRCFTCSSCVIRAVRVHGFRS